MGNNISKPSIGDLDIYICGNLKIYLPIINSIFTIKDSSLNNWINLEKVNEKYYKEGRYQYEYLKLLNKGKNIKGEDIENKYNAFLFLNDVNQDFADILFFYLKEYDVHNKRKNVIICFGFENIIKNAFNKLKDESEESVPILILIDRNFIYDEKLDYINYIPSFSTIKKNLRRENNNYSKQILIELSRKCLIMYIKTKLFRICAYYNEMGYKLNMINPLNDINAKIKLHATIALVGDSGTGKSTLLNIIFNELVSKANASGEDVTLKCSEYYLPVKICNENDENIGQLRFLDFPGLNEEKNYTLVEKEINSKLKAYKKNLEQIDIALFYIRIQGRVINKAIKNLINLLSENNIKILFIINGKVDDDELKTLKQKLRNSIDIIESDFNNLIFTHYTKRLNLIKRDGISDIFQKILDIVQINIINFDVNEIKIETYRNILENLYRTNRIFHIDKDFETMQANNKIKAIGSVSFFSFLALGSSGITIIIPFVDSGITIAFQIAMTYNIFYIYNISPKNFNIYRIILSGGKDISNKILQSAKTVVNEGTKIAKEIIKKEIIKQSTKEVVIKSTNQAVKETTKKVAKDILEETAKQAIEQSVKGLSKEVIEETSRECVKFGLKELNKQMITKGAVIVSQEGAEEIIEVGTKETIKEVSEKIIVSKGSKVWLVNLGKAIPFIGAGISGIINTASTSLLGNRIITYCDSELKKPENRVKLIKGKILALKNIIYQIEKIIEENKN